MKSAKLSFTVLALVALSAPVTLLAEAVGTAFTYQGQLKKDAQPVNDTCDFEFGLWDADTGGSELAPGIATNGIQVVDGLFTVDLDFGAGTFTGGACWLEVTVVNCTAAGPGGTLAPRQEITPAPYAMALPGLWTQAPDSIAIPNIIGGYRNNVVTVGVEAATISGGGGPGIANRITDVGGTVGGGANNQAGDDGGALDDRQFATVAGGWSNVASGLYATVGGGRGNMAGEWNATVGGGWVNQAQADFATIAGGGPSDTEDQYSTNNRVLDNYGTIGGGGNNQAGDTNGITTDAQYATVAGGVGNTAGTEYATVSGGEQNTASDRHATVGGGRLNTASAEDATIGGGISNEAGGLSATVAGGSGNQANALMTTIGGGTANISSSDGATIGGGWQNTADGEYASIGGGQENAAAGYAATVPGGRLNSAAGDHSFAAGQRSKANHAGSFVWADSTDADFATTSDDQFIIRAGGGVGIGTNEPTSALHLKRENSVYARFDHGGDTSWFVGSNSLDNQALSIGESNESGVVTRARFKVGGDISLAPVFGSVGIGTNYPTSPLTVVGVIESTSGGFKFPDGTTQTTAAGESMWSLNGSDIFYDAGRVGIGTSAPVWPLDVEAAQAVGRFVSTGSTYGSVIELRNNDAGADHIGAINFVDDVGSYVGQIGLSAANEMTFSTGGAEAVRIDDTGNVGIGTDSPFSPVHVEADFSSATLGVVTVINNADDSAPAIYAQHTDAGELGYAIRAEAGTAGIAANASGTGDGNRYGAALHAEGGGGDHYGTFTTASGTGSNYGIKAVAGAGTANYGGHFVANDSGATGVYGEASYTGTGGNYGGYFVARSGGGWGVFAEATGDYGMGVVTDGWYGIHASGTGALGSIAVFGENSTGGHAGWFNGDIQVVGTTTTEILTITGGSDLSERFDVSASEGCVRPGMLVCIDPANPGRLIVSSKTYDRTVAGIVSGAGNVKPGLLMGQEGTPVDGAHPVALTGRVWAWCDASGSGIKPGDLLTTSDIPGHAMAVTDHDRAQGAVIGKAMTSLKRGRGLVLVLVSLQ